LFVVAASNSTPSCRDSSPDVNDSDDHRRAPFVKLCAGLRDVHMTNSLIIEKIPNFVLMEDK
jgi:hypothetical protein